MAYFLRVRKKAKELKKVEEKDKKEGEWEEKVFVDRPAMKDLVHQIHDRGILGSILDELGISTDELNTSVADSADDSIQPCGHCTTPVTDDSAGVRCDICAVWYHLENGCAGIDMRYKKLLESTNILYLCDNCKEVDLGVHGKGINTKGIENKLEEIKTNSDQLKLMMQDNALSTREVAENINTMHVKIDDVDRDVKSATGNKTKTYAESVKTKKALVIKYTRDDMKTADEKKSIMGKIATPVEEVKPTKEGHLYVRFADRGNLEKAKKEFERDSNLEIKEKGKIRPKIKIVNIPKEEEDILGSIKMKNPWIKNLIENEDEDLKFIKEIEARNSEYKHYILRCTPQIRKAIDRNNDTVHTLYSSCRVYDHYMPYQCYKCQEFGHSSEHCNKNQICPKCSGDHEAKECNSNMLKCINCTRKGLAEKKHKTFDANKCPIYKEEVSKVRNNTNHGFD